MLNKQIAPAIYNANDGEEVFAQIIVAIHAV